MPSLSRLIQRFTEALPPGLGDSSSSSSGQQRPFQGYTSQSAPPDPTTSTTHYLSSPLPLQRDSPYPAVRETHSSAQPEAQGPISIPPGTLLFTLTHPHPTSSAATGFFLHCLPDPVGFLHHAVVQIMSYLSPAFPNPPQRYRHQSLTLRLDPAYDGLAATSGGELRVSLKWVGDAQKQVEQGRREIQDVTKEFKGVLLHELTHALQHDGFGSTPSWFTESIADWIRLRNGLGPRHWKKCGEGRREKGYETGYDVGAWFLDYLTGDGQVGGTEHDFVAMPEPGGPAPQGQQHPTRTQQAQPPQSTQYSAPPPNHPAPYPKPRSTKPRRRPPIPDLVRQMDHRLEFERYTEDWWVQMAGAPLDVLWHEYLDYYA